MIQFGRDQVQSGRDHRGNPMNDTGPRRDVSDGRKAVYYLGTALAIVGVLLFLSVFVSFAANFGDFVDFEGRARSMTGRAVSGVVLIIVGGALQKLGARGLAGSGLILDPQKSRRDVEPWSRMAGGVLTDALDESGLRPDNSTAPVVKVRCRGCGGLNDEQAKFCDQCGKPI